MRSYSINELKTELRSANFVLGLLLAGSAAKGLEAPASDVDVYIIVSNDQSQLEIERYKKAWQEKYKKLKLDLSNNAVQTLGSFSDYAAIGTPYEWDRYNIARCQLLFDKTNGELTKIWRRKRKLSKQEQAILIENNIGAYINLCYRSMKSADRGDQKTARLDAAESLLYLLNVLFALHGRVRPYNTYLEWEIENYPLGMKLIPDSKLCAVITKSVNADPASQKFLYSEIEKLA